MLKLFAFVRFFSRNGTRLGMKGKKKLRMVEGSLEQL